MWTWRRHVIVVSNVVVHLGIERYYTLFETIQPKGRCRLPGVTGIIAVLVPESWQVRKVILALERHGVGEVVGFVSFGE